MKNIENKVVSPSQLYVHLSFHRSSNHKMFQKQANTILEIGKDPF